MSIAVEGIRGSAHRRIPKHTSPHTREEHMCTNTAPPAQLQERWDRMTREELLTEVEDLWRDLGSVLATGDRMFGPGEMETRRRVSDLQSRLARSGG